MRCGRLIGEIQAYGGLHGLGLAGGFEVHVEDEIVAGIEPPGHAGGFDESGGVDGEFHAGNSLLPIVGVLAAQGGGSVNEDVGVVDDTRCAGLDLHGADVFRLRDWDGKDEVAKKIGAGRGNLHRGFHFEDEIGWA